MKSLAYLLLVYLAFSSCVKDSCISIEQTSNVVSYEYGNMHLYQLKIGDEFHFGKFLSERRPINDSIPFTGDTMVLRVNKLQNDTIIWDAEFKIRDGLSEMNGGVLVPVRDTTIELRWCVNSDQLINLSEIEYGFHLVAEDPLLRRQLPFNFLTDSKYETEGWMINSVYGPWTTQSASGFMLGGTEYRGLNDTMNVQVYDNTPINGTGANIYHVYSIEHGLINVHYSFGYYAEGWIRLKQPH